MINKPTRVIPHGTSKELENQICEFDDFSLLLQSKYRPSFAPVRFPVYGGHGFSILITIFSTFNKR